MTDAANQHIELDGAILAAQVATLRDAASALETAAAATRPDLSPDAFGLISRGLLVPAVDALAARSRELLDSARTLSGRRADATDAATKAFDTLEAEAVRTFSADDA